MHPQNDDFSEGLAAAGVMHDIIFDELCLGILAESAVETALNLREMPEWRQTRVNLLFTSGV